MHLELLNNTEKEPKGKKPGHDGKNRVWLKKFTSIHDRLALERVDA